MKKIPKEIQGAKAIPLNSSKDTPKALSAEEVREIEARHFKRTISEQKIKLIQLERQVSKLTLENVQLKAMSLERGLSEQEAMEKARMENNKREHLGFVEKLKEKYQVKELGYDPQTLELKE